MIGHDNPGKGNNITLFVQVSEFTNQQACCGGIREQRMTTAGNRGDAIDLMVQGMTPPALPSLLHYHCYLCRRIARYIVANPLRAGLVQTIDDRPRWDCIWMTD